uniref:ELYS-bb domain-containing protein n=1 Tax=Trichuris muris TaxID=70415 RepID=A0A5S6QG62_TRIMR
MNPCELGFTSAQWAIVQDEGVFRTSDAQECYQGDEKAANGGYIGNYAWINYGGSLIVYHLSSLRRVATWAVEPASVIAFVCGCKLDVSSCALLLAVNGANGGTVFTFDILSNTAVQLFTIPNKVICLEPVRWPHQNPRIWEGCRHPDVSQSRAIIAVGTTQGHVYLFGGNVFTHDRSGNRRDSFWSKAGCSAKRRNDWSVLIDLTERFRVTNNDTKKSYLHFVSQMGFRGKAAGKCKAIKKEYTSEADLSLCTALHFNQETMILAVGFNFGGVFYYHILFDDFAFNYCIPYDGLEITGFCFVEPEESPRNVVYLVVSRYGQFAAGHVGSTFHIIDLQFAYKEQLEDGTNLYSDCIGSRRGFSMHASNCGKFLIHATSRKHLQNEGESDTFSPSIYFLNVNTEGNIFGFFFDFNSWYHAQTPTRVLKGYHGLCPFMSMHAYSAKCPILDFMVNPSIGVEYHDLLLESDFAYYPCNYSMTVQLLTSKGIVHCAFQSLQEQTFTELEVHIYDFESIHHEVALLQRAGLIDRSSSLSKCSEDDKRLLVWTAMLSAKRLHYLSSCTVVPTVHSSILVLFKDWMWQRSVHAKEDVQEIAVNHLGCDLETLPDVHRKIVSSREAMEILLKVHENLTKAELASSQEDKARYEAMTLISLFIRMVTWFMRRGNYFFASTNACWTNRGSNKHAAGPRRTMFIHKFTEVLRSQTEGHFSQVAFPPRSLAELLQIYLLPSLDLSTKHFAVCYVLLENLLHCENENSMHKAKEFICLFEKQILDETDPSLAKYAWSSVLIDHGNEEEGESWLLRAAMFPSALAALQLRRNLHFYFKYKLPLPVLLAWSAPERTNQLPEVFRNQPDAGAEDQRLPVKNLPCKPRREASGRRLLSWPRTASDRTDRKAISPAEQLIVRMRELQAGKYTDFAINPASRSDVLPTDIADEQRDTTVRRCSAIMDILKATVRDVLPELAYVAPDMAYGLTKSSGIQLVLPNGVEKQESRKRGAVMLDVNNSPGVKGFRFCDYLLSSPIVKRRKKFSSSHAPLESRLQAKEMKLNVPLECWAERKSLVDLRHHRNFWEVLLAFKSPVRRLPMELKSPSSVTSVLAARSASGVRASKPYSVPKRVRFCLTNESDQEHSLRKSTTTISPQILSKSNKLHDTENSPDGGDDLLVPLKIVHDVQMKSSAQSEPQFFHELANNIDNAKSTDNVTGNAQSSSIGETNGEIESEGQSDYCQPPPKCQKVKPCLTDSAVLSPEERTGMQKYEEEEEKQAVSSVKLLPDSHPCTESTSRETVRRKTQQPRATKIKPSTSRHVSSEQAAFTQSQELPEQGRNENSRYYLRSLKKRRSLN